MPVGKSLSNQPIGVFDSGVGGLTVLQELVKCLPNENYIYLGDTARVPYGNKSEVTIKKYSLQLVEFLLKKQVKALVIACNTIASIAYDDILMEVDIPIIDVVRPTAQYAWEKSRTKHLGLVGTTMTIQQNFYQKYLNWLDKRAVFQIQECPLLASIVEEGLVNNKIAREAVDHYLKSFEKDSLVDVLILGCTHYPVLQELIARNIPKDILIIASGEPTAQKLKEVLKIQGLFNEQDGLGEVRYFCTDSPERFWQISRRLVDNSFISQDQIEQVKI